MNLQEFFKEHKKVGLAFSGGVDSSYLLYAGKKYGVDMRAYFVKTQFQPSFELEDAKRLARDIRAEFVILEGDALKDRRVSSNPENRCYYCKQNIFSLICSRAKEDGYFTIIDGTNASDEAGDRPGMKALGEMKVLSPLRLCNLTKEDVRKLSKEGDLFTWQKPSYACLATRVPAFMEITEELLKKIEKSEDALYEMGFNDFRVRVTENGARLEMNGNFIDEAFQKRKEIVRQLKPYFDKITLDLEER